MIWFARRRLRRQARRDLELYDEFRDCTLPRLMELLAIVGAALLMRGSGQASELVSLAAEAAAQELRRLEEHC